MLYLDNSWPLSKGYVLHNVIIGQWIAYDSFSHLDVDPSLALYILRLLCLILHVYTSSRHLTFDDNISHEQNVVSICLLKEGVFSTIPISISLHESGIFAWRTRVSPVKGICFREYSFIEITAVLDICFQSYNFVLSLVLLALNNLFV